MGINLQKLSRLKPETKSCLIYRKHLAKGTEFQKGVKIIERKSIEMQLYLGNNRILSSDSEIKKTKEKNPTIKKNKRKNNKLRFANSILKKAITKVDKTKTTISESQHLKKSVKATEISMTQTEEFGSETMKHFEDSESNSSASVFSRHTFMSFKVNCRTKVTSLTDSKSTEPRPKKLRGRVEWFSEKCSGSKSSNGTPNFQKPGEKFSYSKKIKTGDAPRGLMKPTNFTSPEKVSAESHFENPSVKQSTAKPFRFSDAHEIMENITKSRSHHRRPSDDGYPMEFLIDMQNKEHKGDKSPHT
ncbi:hypothetical protein CEXT_217371 [Caerostris extrusa]|uniref:Uncharacterized protein n=1 Tax=Caerostris extrusa TaxID=172846 RepID=A0AAV4SKL8_CAEEX|nr:hypothetical protein CEXT_217371 [Caerostris extrusa]